MKRILLIALVMFSVLPFAACGGSGDLAETTFTLQNDTDQVMYVQDWEWFRLIADGEMVSPTDTLCMRRCGDVFGGRIACAEAARLATVVELQPGESVERTWDGVYYEINEAQSCYRERHRGTLDVEYCYSDSFDDTDTFDDGNADDGVHPGGWIENPTCERERIIRGEDMMLSIN